MEDLKIHHSKITLVAEELATSRHTAVSKGGSLPSALLASKGSQLFVGN